VIDADDEPARRASHEFLDCDSRAEADFKHSVLRLHVEEPDRPDVAFPVRPSLRHHPPGGAAAEAVRTEELTEDRAQRLLLESHDLMQQLQVGLKSRDGG
jgi:hypothetical protein